MASFPYGQYNPQPYGFQPQSFGYGASQSPYAASMGQQLGAMPMYQQTGPQTASGGVHGRIVEAIESVTANEVPTDGSVGYFPIADGSAIYAKTWTNDGRIITARYSRDDQGEEPAAPEVTLLDVMNQLQTLSDAVDALTAASQPKPARTASKRGAEDA